ncbi:hypothetical protein OHC33_007873 [Knufia fluminis]|uniref:RING-type domain-containing protein n=1 Tax=Knufia fluminis TaxID=191047 RepID=A0AAN8EJS5_9EURO|nr:hypothetical protein OHC33_007873 [Knufia fluminis]
MLEDNELKEELKGFVLRGVPDADLLNAVMEDEKLKVDVKDYVLRKIPDDGLMTAVMDDDDLKQEVMEQATRNLNCNDLMGYVMEDEDLKQEVKESAVEHLFADQLLEYVMADDDLKRELKNDLVNHLSWEDLVGRAMDGNELKSELKEAVLQQMTTAELIGRMLQDEVVAEDMKARIFANQRLYSSTQPQKHNMGNHLNTTKPARWARLRRALHATYHRSAKGRPHPHFTDLLITHGVPLRTDKEDQECPICKVEIESTDESLTHTSCKVSYHRECLEHWLKDNSTCPFNRQIFTTNPKHEKQRARTLARQARRTHRAETRRRLDAWTAHLDATFGRNREYTSNFDYARVIMDFETRLAYENETGIPRARHLEQYTEEILRHNVNSETLESNDRSWARDLASQRLQREEFEHFFGTPRTEIEVERVLWGLEEMGIQTHFLPWQRRHYRRRYLAGPLGFDATYWADEDPDNDNGEEYRLERCTGLLLSICMANFVNLNSTQSQFIVEAHSVLTASSPISHLFLTMSHPTITRQTSLPTTQSEAKWRDSRLMTDDIHIERARYLRRRASRELWAATDTAIPLPDMLPGVHARRWGQRSDSESVSTVNADAGTESETDNILAYDADTDSDDEASLNPLVRSWDIDEELQRYHEDVWRWEIELSNRLMEGRSGREREEMVSEVRVGG